eukprot:c44592_g1_i1 orf=2-235(+)
MWVQLEVAKELITVVNIYAPNLSKEREELWQRLGDASMKGKCVLLGDFNMIENGGDRRGVLRLPSRAWRRIVGPISN